MKQDFTNDTLLARWLSGSLDDAEKQELKNHPDYPLLKKIADQTADLAPPPYDSQAALNQFKTNRANSKKQPKVVKMKARRRLTPWIGVAAALALLTAFWFLRPDSKQRFEALPGQTIEAALADGSTARLNASSDLSFEEKENKRLASLNGEGYFEVKKSSIPFIVNTSLGEVEVLGTSFNVYSRDSIFRVSCNTGKVGVRLKNQSTAYTLIPGKSIEWRSSQPKPKQYNGIKDGMDWIGGQSIFSKASIAEVMAEMERLFDVKFNIATSLDTQRLISITLPNDNIDKAMEVLTKTVGNLEYETEGKQINVRLSDS